MSLSLADCETKLEQSLMDEGVPVNSLSLAELPKAESELVEISKRNLKQNSVPGPDIDIVGQEITRVSCLSEPPVAPDTDIVVQEITGVAWLSEPPVDLTRQVTMKQLSEKYPLCDTRVAQLSDQNIELEECADKIKTLSLALRSNNWFNKFNPIQPETPTETTQDPRFPNFIFTTLPSPTEEFQNLQLPVVPPPKLSTISEELEILERFTSIEEITQEIFNRAFESNRSLSLNLQSTEENMTPRKRKRMEDERKVEVEDKIIGKKTARRESSPTHLPTKPKRKCT